MLRNRGKGRRGRGTQTSNASRDSMSTPQEVSGSSQSASPSSTRGRGTTRGGGRGRGSARGRGSSRGKGSINGSLAGNGEVVQIQEPKKQEGVESKAANIAAFGSCYAERRRGRGRGVTRGMRGRENSRTATTAISQEREETRGESKKPIQEKLEALEKVRAVVKDAQHGRGRGKTGRRGSGRGRRSNGKGVQTNKEIQGGKEVTIGTEGIEAEASGTNSQLDALGKGAAATGEKEKEDMQKPKVENGGRGGYRDKKRAQRNRRARFKNGNDAKVSVQYAKSNTGNTEQDTLNKLPLFPKNKERKDQQEKRYKHRRGEEKPLKEGKRENGLRGPTPSSKSNKDNSEELKFLNQLQAMSFKDPDTIVLELTTDHNMPNTVKLLSGGLPMDDTKVVALLKVLARACECTTVLSSLHKILSKLPKSKYMSLHLSNYINRLAITEIDFKEREEQLRLMIKLFSEILRKQPSSFADLPIPQLLFSVTMLSTDEKLLDEAILSAVQELNSLRETMAEKIKEEEQVNKKPKRTSRRDRAALHDDDAPPEDFRGLSVIPQEADILSTDAPFLRRNKTDGRYKSTEDYLDVQFRLLREDFIRPLREGINELQSRMGSTKTGPLQDIRVYHDVHILYPVSTQKGMTYRISFDVSRLKGVRWENTKRLIYGSLLCLSKDNFETFILATVEKRDVWKLNEGQLEILLANSFYAHQFDFRDQSAYQMVETMAYFEAYRHVLDGLQSIVPRKFPFKRYIVKCKQDTKPPAYVKNRFRETDITYDFGPIMARPGHARFVRILDKSSWPSADELELDNAQYEAVKHALTSDFALIQGPPGTGKTYIGLKVAKVLLHNKSKWETSTDTTMDDSSDEENTKPQPIIKRVANVLRRAITNHPILVVCYTNHALDQFLEGIQDFHPEGIVRVGSRSQSEKMQKCNLGVIKRNIHLKKKRDKDNFDSFEEDLEYPDYDVLRNAPCQVIPRDISHYFWVAKEELKQYQKITDEATENLRKCMENVIHENELARYGYMNGWHYDHLTIDPITGVRANQSVMHYWLGLVDDSPFESSNFVQPIATFPFNQEFASADAMNDNHTAIINNSELAPGPFESFNGSYELQGSHDSFIFIPNMENGFLDTCQSMSIVLSVYPMSLCGGPIVCFQDQGFIGILISQDGVIDGKAVLTAVFNGRNGTLAEPLSCPVLHMNEWNCIAVTYEFGTGICRLWHGDVEVGSTKMNGGQEIGSQFPVYIGSLNIPWHTSYFQGRVCNLNIFPGVIGRNQIRSMAGILEGDEDEAESNDFLFEAQAEQERRMLDIDDDFDDFYPGKAERKKNSLATADASFTNSRNDQFAWQQAPKSGKRRNKIKHTIKDELGKKDMMTEDESIMVDDVWQLSLLDRWRLYRYWMNQLATSFIHVIRRYQAGLKGAAQRLNEVRSLEDKYILEKATVIGMTTTGAARCRRLIQDIQPRIVIVEEAAEVLESHIVTSLSPGCQHLILIGDHQQLRPNPTVYDLALNYQLEMSLFERMVNTGVPFKRLNLQHRMRPEIASMMSHIYEDLQNHESVLKFESITGVDSNIFFIDHHQLEELVKEGQSRSNWFEAEYIVALCRYFIQQGYKNEQITILTMYTGQLLSLKKMMPKEFFQGVRVCAVDNFQGEENDIILMSLVRSNEEGNIGFLKIANRVCVALSRAKKGFYCIRNLELLCAKNELWSNIIHDMREQEKAGPYLTLRCQMHPTNVIKASNAEDFNQAPLGGCKEPCNARLNCGHVCEIPFCHPADPNHEEYKCKKKCTRTVCEEHSTKCRKLCWNVCDVCRELVLKEIPECHDEQNVPCYMDPSKFLCQTPCNKLLKCGHNCEGICGRCSKDPNHEAYICRQQCKKIVCTTHSTECNRQCCQPCDVCHVLVTKEIPTCHHNQDVPCSLDADRFVCTVQCDALLDCKHHCKGTCGMCIKDPKHKDYKCQEKCKKIVCSEHSTVCTQLCSKNCDRCQVVVTKEIPKCLHELKVPCYKDPSEVKCNKPCRNKLPCGQHNCQRKCYEKCDSVCKVIVDKTLKCGHVNKATCQGDRDDFKCTTPCGGLLNCKHRCSGTCGECFRSRLHLPCKAKCQRRLLCGHACKDACKKNCPPCREKCENGCVHAKCTKRCAEPCSPCMLPCEWKCLHYECTQLCGEPCDRPRCNKPCTTTLQCGHPCIGMCGEPCPKKCRTCDKDEVTEVRLGGEDEPNARFVELEACGHVFEVKCMDRYMDDVTDMDGSIIQLKGCPRCHKPIRISVRYGTIIKRILSDIEKVKSKVSLTNEELKKKHQSLRHTISRSGNGINSKLVQDVRKIIAVLNTKKLVSTDQLDMYENTFNFLCFLSKVMNTYTTNHTLHFRCRVISQRKHHQDRMSKHQTKISNLALALRDRIMQTNYNKGFSDQEKEEISDEMARLFLVWLHGLLLALMELQKVPLADSRLKNIADVIGAGQKIGKDDLDTYISVIQDVDSKHSLGLKLQCQRMIQGPQDQDSRPQIVKSVKMEQGHWFKCPEDHVFYSSEPKVLEESHCEECQVATECASSAPSVDSWD